MSEKNKSQSPAQKKAQDELAKQEADKLIAEQLKKDQAAEAAKLATQKKKDMKGSLDKSYKVPKGEENLVHYKLTDYASPRSRDLNKEFKPVVRIVKTHPEMFVRQFAGNFQDNEAFLNVSTPGLISRLHNNIEKEHIEAAYEDEIHSATKGRPKLKAEWVQSRLDKKKELRLVGGNQVILKGGILHIPTDDDNFPFNPKDMSKFPDECMY